MSGRYEPVSSRDDDSAAAQPANAVPSSPPPSFHSRASSFEHRRAADAPAGVDPDLAGAFDDADDSDAEPDDRQLLVRNASFPTRPTSPSDTDEPPAAPVASTARPAAAATAASQPRRGQSSAPFRVFGSGIQSDGVFSNMTAKPERGDEKEDLPPTYEQAAADAAPPYWETTIIAPGFGGPDDVYVDGMPVGSAFSFVWNGMISMSFQVPGFLLTYLLHSSHAAKNGSLAGLGVTLIQYGFLTKSPDDADGAAPGASGPGGEQYASPPDPNSHDFDPGAVAGDGGSGGFLSDIGRGDWMGYALMIAGWFVLIRAVTNYLRARRHEQLVLQSPERGLPIPVIAEGEAAERVV